ncbi:SDR family NAD(P)-dependent oxidoreductase [Nonomuraea thailandensis]
MRTSAAWTLQSVPDQTGRVAVVTGANSGIGYVTARELARRGAHVVLACRDPGRGGAALARMREEVPGARLELRQVDLASLASIREFAAGWRRGPLDLLVNNAGVAMVPYAVTADGFESQFGIDHLGTFALTGLLLPHLLAAPDPRVVTVSSEGQRFARFDLGNLNAERGYRAAFAYVQAKRANLYFAVELQRRADAAGLRLRSTAVAPGLTRTNVLTGGANGRGGCTRPSPACWCGSPSARPWRGRRPPCTRRPSRICRAAATSSPAARCSCGASRSAAPASGPSATPPRPPNCGGCPSASPASATCPRRPADRDRRAPAPTAPASRPTS